MTRLTETKIVLVVRATRLADLKAKFVTKSQARFYISSLGADFEDYEKEDLSYQTAIATAQQSLTKLGRVQVVHRSFLPNFVFGPEDIVVVIGQDGLVANTMKYLTGQPIIGINPDPKRWDGQLLPFQIRDLDQVTRQLIRGGGKIHQVTMAEAKLNTGQSLCAVNDLFVGMKSHASARYCICIGENAENHSSSGVVISTGLGSTGWLKSLITGAVGVAQAAGRVPEVAATEVRFPWDSDFLRFTVREPFPSKTTGTSIVFGEITAAVPLVLESQMGENGVIFSDGIEQDFLEFNSGTKAIISLAERKGHLVV
jgi:NAD kinase